MIKNNPITVQYLTGLIRSMQLIDEDKVSYHGVKIHDLLLAKLLQAICFAKQLHLPTVVTELLTQQLSKDKTYKEYFSEDDMDCSVEDIKTLKIFKKPTMATKETRDAHTKTD